MNLISGWPECAVCEKPVEKMESHYDNMKLATVVTVWCHGAIQEAELSDRLLCAANSVEASRAFEDGVMSLQLGPRPRALGTGK